MPVKNTLNITGLVFGNLTAVKFIEMRKQGSYWEFKCNCGATIIRRAALVNSGHTRSCGCLKKEVSKLSGAKKLKNIAGKTFGYLTALHRYGSTKRGQSTWTCLCICGNHKVIAASHLQRGTTTSCGCKRYENSITHNLSNSSEYGIWTGMIQRCTNKNRTAFKDYGGRGIFVCERWVNSFENFYSDLGPRPSDEHSIDRINPDGNYEPGNVRWATSEEQRLNQRVCVTTKIYPGVLKTNKNTFSANICRKGKRMYLGTFKTVSEAIEARQHAERNFK